jgi:hypothetical protein
MKRRQKQSQSSFIRTSSKIPTTISFIDSRTGSGQNGGGCGGFLLVGEPDVAIDVSQNERFESLQPGESWVTSQLLHDKSGTVLPNDATDGEEFRYQFNGETVDWWDWGSKAEHAETVVKLPCWLAGRVVEPKDNNGRPKLVVPTSQMISFSVRE